MADESVGGVGGVGGVGELAELYLGNLLYALERCAMALEAEGKKEDAAFYRAIARKMAAARGQTER